MKTWSFGGNQFFPPNKANINIYDLHNENWGLLLNKNGSLLAFYLWQRY